MIYCQTASVSAAHATRCATYCTPCQQLMRGFFGCPTTLTIPVVMRPLPYYLLRSRKKGALPRLAARTRTLPPYGSTIGRQAAHAMSCFVRAGIPERIKRRLFLWLYSFMLDPPAPPKCVKCASAKLTHALVIPRPPTECENPPSLYVGVTSAFAALLTRQGHC